MTEITYEFFVENVLNDPKFSSKQVYQEYLRTDRWKELRLERLDIDGLRCRMCDDDATCVHHRWYPDVLGEETVDDLTSLCHHCHDAYHKMKSTV